MLYFETEDSMENNCSLNQSDERVEIEPMNESNIQYLRPLDFTLLDTSSGPYMGTNVSATSGCHQCCSNDVGKCK